MLMKWWNVGEQVQQLVLNKSLQYKYTRLTESITSKTLCTQEMSMPSTTRMAYCHQFLWPHHTL